MWRLAVIDADGVRNVGQKIVEVLKSMRGILWVGFPSAIAHPAESDFYIVRADDPPEFLFAVQRPPSQFQYFGARRTEQVGYREQRHAPAHAGLLDFFRMRGIHHIPELLVAVQEAAVISEPGLRNPGPFRQHVLRGNAILLVKKYLIVRDVLRWILRVRPHSRIGDG